MNQGYNNVQTNNSIKVREPIIYKILNRKLLFLLSVFLIFFFFGNITMPAITQVNEILFELLNLYVHEVASGWISTIIIWLAIVNVLATVFFSNKNLNNLYIESLQFILFSSLIIVLVTWVIYSEEGEVTNTISEFGDETQQNTISAYDNFICNGALRYLNKDNEKCVALRNQNVVEQDTKQEFKVRGIKSEITTKKIETVDETFKVRYEFETEIPINVEKIECFTSKNTREPFFVSEDLNIQVKSNQAKQFTCENIAGEIEKEEEELKIITYLYYSVDQSNSVSIPAINCQNNLIKNYLNSEDIACEDLTLEDIKSNQITSSIPKYDLTPTGTSAIEINLPEIQYEVPLHLGDQSQKEIDFTLEITRDSKTGDVVSQKITRFTLPTDILDYANDNERQKINDIKNNDEENENLFVEVLLSEISNDINLENSGPVIVEDIKFETQITAKQKLTTNPIKFKKDESLITS